MEKPDVVADISRQLSKEVARVTSSIIETTAAAEDIFQLIKIASMFGLEAENFFVLANSIRVTYKNMESCQKVLPLLELIESKGFIFSGSNDYPEIKNRDFCFSRGRVQGRLEVYFGEGCIKVPVGSVTEYRLQCSTEDPTEAEANTVAPVVRGVAKSGDDIPF